MLFMCRMGHFRFIGHGFPPWQAAEKYPSAALLSSFVVAAFGFCLPAAGRGALHLGIFEQPAKNDFISATTGLIQGH
jgi:hypothetical protein